MADRMQKCVTRARRVATKRPPAQRIADFGEIRSDLGVEEAARQAARCEQCGTPYCQVYCPLHNNIPDWLKITGEGRMEDAYHLAQATNNFPEICGRLCPQERLCEAKWACTLEHAGHGAVTIGGVERHVGETAWAEGWVRPRVPQRLSGRSVGIVGAGPAGMAAAEELRAAGHEVHLYGAHARLGGLMSYGIPEFKMEQQVVARRARLLRDAGVVFHGNRRLGREITLEGLRLRHDAVVLAYGAQLARGLDTPGAELPGVISAMDYLVSSSRALIRETETPEIDAADKWVVVIGGGDTAMDCVRTAVGQGAAGVTCLYRRDQANIPGSAREVEHAEEEGANFDWQSQPEALMDVPVDVIASRPEGPGMRGVVRAFRTRLAASGAGGRLVPERVPGSGFEIAAMLTDGAVAVTAQGRIAADRDSRMTASDGVFAAGDARLGPSLAVWAIREGREVAAAVARYLDIVAGHAELVTDDATS
ncbi:oxidoreductase [Allgaiera indica]|uniref:Glutamate synthase (NADH) small subunit n=1 Tax=Allgaiera indica TaxID=765699 RepID=A0AAN4UV91_9RHOB|nr:glutamate synthase subunit beta [Allgaiera indica]GHE06059.1 oxidoreductase [Allgaiera indica]SDX84039.1 glutamate synthase (NADH) small subunit [Allgaiera indica]